jgi:hypothetical protein
VSDTLPVAEKLRVAAILEKSAELLVEKDNTIASLEAKLSEMEATLNHEKQAANAQVPEELASQGLTMEEAQELMGGVSPALLRKVANLLSRPSEGWELGGAANNNPAPEMDPLEAFVFGTT